MNNEKNKDDKKMLQKVIDLNDPETSIIDINKGEKIITELNNLICLGEYELARPMFKQIIDEIPCYFENFYKLIFMRGIPDKWLLTNQLRTSANYIWILYQDYNNEFSKVRNCPNILFNNYFINANEFDLLITEAFYSSYEITDGFKMNKKFLFDLRNIFNFYQSRAMNQKYYLPKLRILPPEKSKSTLYFSIRECYYGNGVNSNLDFENSSCFFDNMQNLILSQPKISKIIIDKIINHCHSSQKIQSSADVIFFEEKIHMIYVNFAMLFIHIGEYEKVYEYLKYMHYNESIELNRNYIILLLSVIVMISTIQSKKEKESPNEVLKFVNFSIKKLNIITKDKPYIDAFKHLPYFTSKSSNHSIKISDIDSSKKDHQSLLSKSKIFESLLGNEHNKELIQKIKLIYDYYIEYKCKDVPIQYFFAQYNFNISNEDFYSSLTYEELSSLIYSQNQYHEDNLMSLWIKANKNIFWNDYINFIRIHSEHVLSFPLLQSMNNIDKSNFETAVTFLHPMNNLKLLLILLVWNKFSEDITMRKQILDVFWKSYNDMKSKTLQYESSQYLYVPLFEDVIIKLEYLLNFSMWIENKTNIPSNETYNDLLNHSIPYVMKSNLLNYNFDDIVKYFVLNMPKGNLELQKNHFHSAMIIFSIFLYHFIFKKLDDKLNTTINEDDISCLFTEEDKKVIKGILHKIVLFPYRLNILVDIFNLAFINTKEYIDKDNQFLNMNANTKHSHRIFLYNYNKKFCFEFISLLNESIEPMRNFDFDNQTVMFESKKLIDDDIIKMINGITNKKIFLEDLRRIDSDFIIFKKNNNSHIEYKEYLKSKMNTLISNVDELLLRYNIIDNPWLEIIYHSNKKSNISFLEALNQNEMEYFQIAKKFHMYETAKKAIAIFDLNNENNTLSNSINELEKFVKIKEDTANTKEKIDIDKIFISYSDFLTDSNDESAINFKKFKILFDLSLSEGYSVENSLFLLDKALYYLDNSSAPTQDRQIFTSLIENYKSSIDLSKVNEKDTLCKLISNIKTN